MKIYFIVVGYVSVKWEPSQATQEQHEVTPDSRDGVRDDE